MGKPSFKERRPCKSLHLPNAEGQIPHSERSSDETFDLYAA